MSTNLAILSLTNFVLFRNLVCPERNKMNGFEPTLLGIVTYVITISQLNEALQSLLIIATLVYTVIKIMQLINGKD